MTVEPVLVEGAEVATEGGIGAVHDEAPHDPRASRRRASGITIPGAGLDSQEPTRSKARSVVLRNDGNGPATTWRSCSAAVRLVLGRSTRSQNAMVNATDPGSPVRWRRRSLVRRSARDSDCSAPASQVRTSSTAGPTSASPAPSIAPSSRTARATAGQTAGMATETVELERPHRRLVDPGQGARPDRRRRRRLPMLETSRSAAPTSTRAGSGSRSPPPTRPPSTPCCEELTCTA